MRIARLRFMAVALAIVGSGIAISVLHARQSPPAWVVGDVFVATGVGKYEVWSNAGTKKQDIVIPTGLTPGQSAGCWFDSQFNLYTADTGNTKVFIHPLASPHTPQLWVDTSAQANNGHSTSIVMAVNGDVFVGNPGGGAPSKSILRYRSDKTFLTKYNPATESSGIDWIDLATDQVTMFYTSQGRLIKRFNVGTNTQLPNYATLQGTGTAYALRLLGPSFNGSNGLLVADNANIKQLDSAGTQIATYDYDPAGTANDENAWRALNLDPDGLHFWAVGFTTGKLFRFALGSSAPDLGPLTTGGAGNALGLCVMGEPQTQIVPLVLNNPSGLTDPSLNDITAPFGDPTATGENDFYSFSTWRLRIHVKPTTQPIVAAVSFTPQTTDLQCTGNPSNDFDCRFAEPPPDTQCVPFFRDPSAASQTGLLQYRCAYYRVKDMPTCSLSSPGSCPFDEPFVGTNPSNPADSDILSEVVLNLTNPPTAVFDASFYGPAPKGNPRIMRDPDSVNTGPLANQFFIDATTAIIDWPALGTGTPNDYTPVQRRTDIASTTAQGCIDIIKPDSTGGKIGSVFKVIIEAKTGFRGTNGLCTGSALTNLTTFPNNLTLAITNPAQNVLVIYCDTPGNSLGCFTPVNGQPGRYQSTIDLTQPPFIPDAVHPYFFAITSVNVPSADPNTQGAGNAPPVGRSYFICPNGGNCGG